MLLVELDRLEFHEIVMHGVPARRTARHFGLDYNYEQRAHADEAEPLPPRSAYALAGEARTGWQHSVPPTKALRYSITFRTLKPRVSRVADHRAGYFP
jgi:hypothetical protein